MEEIFFKSKFNRMYIGAIILGSIWLLLAIGCKPIADAGADKVVEIGNIIQLDGSGSSGSGSGELTYRWSVSSAPSGSTAELNNSTIVNPSFTPDKIGRYVLNLIVSDGSNFSRPDTVTISVIDDIPREARYGTAIFGEDNFN